MIRKETYSIERILPLICDHKGVKIKLFSYLTVGNFVQRKLAECFVFPRLSRNPITSFITGLKCLFEKFNLSRRRKKFYVRSQFHISNIEHISTVVKNYFKKGGAIPPSPEGDSLLGNIYEALKETINKIKTSISYSRGCKLTLRQCELLTKHLEENDSNS